MMFRNTMRTVVAVAVLTTLVGSQALAAPQRPSRDTTAQREISDAPTGRITGRVLAADGGRPITRALVRITAPDLPGGRSAVTDDRGAFDFEQLPASRYTVTAAKAGFVTLSYGQRRPLQAGTPLQLGAGQHLRDLELRLPRGSAVAGRVFDENGEPMPGATVRVMRYQYAQGNRQLVPAGAAQTDDRGQYRVWGLNPGDYYVSVIVRNVGAGARGGDGRGGRGLLGAPGGRGVFPPDVPSDEEVGYAPTFYPGVASAAEALAVNVGLSAELLDVDFSVLLVPTSTVSGRVANGDGSVATGGSVNLTPEAGSGRSVPGPGYGARVRGDGSFTIANVPPGRYILRARTDGRSSPAYAAQPISVTGSGDISDVMVTLASGATITGTVTIQATQSALQPDLRQIRINVPPADAGGFAAGGNGRVDPDGRFSVENVPAGPHWIRAQAPRGWVLKSAVVDGRDALDEPLDVRSAQRISGVSLVFTDRLSEISGTVADEQGTPLTELTMLAFSTNAAFWRPESRHIMTARPDQTGRFQLRGLPAGEYYLAAIDPAEPGEWFEPSFLEQQRLAATRILLAEGDVKTQDIRVAPR
jgi:protocatechuate 3,4-dioxygenase beta subunit